MKYDKSNKTKKLLKKELNAAFTIEAAVIVPISLMIVMTILFLSFYLHDLVTVTAVNEYVIYEAAHDMKEDQYAAQDLAETILSGKLLTAKDACVSITAGKNKASSVISAVFTAPLDLIKTMMGNMSEISSSIDVSNLNGREQLIIYKAVMDGIEDIFAE